MDSTENGYESRSSLFEQTAFPVFYYFLGVRIELGVQDVTDVRP